MGANAGIGGWPYLILVRARFPLMMGSGGSSSMVVPTTMQAAAQMVEAYLEQVIPVCLLTSWRACSLLQPETLATACVQYATFDRISQLPPELVTVCCSGTCQGGGLHATKHGL